MAEPQATFPDPTNPLFIDELSFYAALNLISSNGPLLVKSNVLGDPELTNAGIASQYTAATQIQLQGSFGTGSPGNFQLPTDTDFYMTAVPEPSSVVAWAALIGVGAVGGRRRRRNKK